MNAAAREIHLLRHAKSDWGDPGLRDRERPLAPRGRKAAEAMARHLRDEGFGVDLVLCSPARRTRETLEAISGALSGAEVTMEGEIYGATARELVELLRAVPDPCRSVLLIGHNPGFEMLAEALLGPGEHDPSVERMLEKYPTGALASFETTGRWSDLAPGTCTLRSFVRPRDLVG